MNTPPTNFLCAMKKLRRGWFAVLLGLGVCGVASAHDPGISMAQGQFRATGLEILVGFAPLDAEQLLPPEARVSGKWTQAEFVAAQPLLAELAPQIFEVRAGGVELAPRHLLPEGAEGEEDVPGDLLSLGVGVGGEEEVLGLQIGRASCRERVFRAV